MIECGLSPDNRTNLRRLTPKLISLKHLKPNRKDSKFKLFQMWIIKSKTSYLIF